MADYTTALGRVTCTLSSHARVARPGTGCRHRETGLGRASTGEIGSASANGGEARRSGYEGLRSGSLERVSSVTSRHSVNLGGRLTGLLPAVSLLDPHFRCAGLRARDGIIKRHFTGGRWLDVREVEGAGCGRLWEVVADRGGGNLRLAEAGVAAGGTLGSRGSGG